MWYSVTKWSGNPRDSLLDACVTDVNQNTIGIVSCPQINCFPGSAPVQLSVSMTFDQLVCALH